MEKNTQNYNNFILYNSDDGNVNLNVLLQNETIWLTQKMMAELFDVGVPAINKHLTNIFESKELQEISVISILETTATDGKNYKTKFYNLDAIISVGYRVNSSKATQFRIWATQTLKEYIIKGFVMDDERLKQGNKVFGKDYFRELLERVRSIRASERRVYQQVTDIFSECSIDYDRNSEITRNFFANIQNKFHFAIVGKTSAEIIHGQADAGKKNMGLETWKNSPDGRILKSDTEVAKNYLKEDQIKRLERTVSAYFDYIENQIEMKNTFTMETLAESINKFLSFNDFKVLDGKGSVSRQQALEKAEKQYQEFNKTQKILSDFDKHIKKMKK